MFSQFLSKSLKIGVKSGKILGRNFGVSWLYFYISEFLNGFDSGKTDIFPRKRDFQPEKKG